MVVPWIYMKSLSVKRGSVLPVYVSYDDSMAEIDAYLRIFPVDKLAVVVENTLTKTEKVTFPVDKVAKMKEPFKIKEITPYDIPPVPDKDIPKINIKGN